MQPRPEEASRPIRHPRGNDLNAWAVFTQTMKIAPAATCLTRRRCAHNAHRSPRKSRIQLQRSNFSKPLPRPSTFSPTCKVEELSCKRTNRETVNNEPDESYTIEHAGPTPDELRQTQRNDNQEYQETIVLIDECNKCTDGDGDGAIPRR